MPIVKSNTGALMWENPTQENIDSFKKSVLDSSSITYQEKNQLGLIKKLDEFVIDTLNGAKRLADSNEAIFNSLNVITKEGLGIVDIIVPVYGSFYILKECIRTIEERTNWPYRITIIDDCSPEEKTKDYLRELENKWTGSLNKHQVIYNKKNKGFAATVNSGIRATNGRYICILNSDVLVTQNWLTKMVLALESNPKNKIVNPCTNNTALIDVPMQPGTSYIDMNRALEKVSSHRYPEVMPTGFCFMFNRALTRSVGFLDEGFENYGEETDFWMRTITHVQGGEYPRWKAVLADDTYLFHERGSSFSSLGHSVHMSKRRDGSDRFHSRWPSFKNWQKSFDIKKTMAPLRSTLPISSVQNSKWKYNIAFVTYSTAYCGGMKYITDIVNYLIENNVNVKVVQIKRNPTQPIETLGELRIAPIIFNDPEDAIRNFKVKVFDRGVVVAATNELALIVKHICFGDDRLNSVLFAQSHDPLIAPGPEMKELMEEAYKSVDHIISNAEWLDSYIKETHGVDTLGFVRPGYDSDVFFKRDRELGDDRPTVLISLLKSYPFKGYDRGITLAVTLSKLIQRNNENFRIMAIGTTQAFECPDVICLGAVSPNYLSKLLSTEVDIFVDPSYIHTYGLPSIEAMASGVVPVSWDNYGINEYAVNGKNSLIFPNNAPPEALAKEIFDLLKDKVRLNNMKNETVKIDQTRKDSVKNFVNILEKKLNIYSNPKNIAIITPHLRKRGGPVTIMDIANKLQDKGHQVDMYTLHSDLNTDLLKNLRVPIHIDWKNIKKCDLLITNSDNPENIYFNKLKQVRKKVLLKLSHNKRFQVLEDNSLKLKWDKIITSTQWLVDSCINPRVSEGWTHPPQPAVRLGWYHYDHSSFSKPPNEIVFRTLEDEKVPIIVGILAHHYPLKGTPDSLKVLEILKKKYGTKLYVVAVGEQEEFTKTKPSWVNFLYNLPRNQLTEVMAQTDIWLNCSHTEGLGRMTLEAMSASCGIVTTTTEAEFTVEGENCLMAPIGDIRKITEAVDLLIKDPELRKKLATAGHETAKKWSNSEEYSDKLNKIIKDIFEND